MTFGIAFIVIKGGRFTNRYCVKLNTGRVIKLINKYGILIKKKLQDNYPEKYESLKEKGKLLAIIRDKQYEIEQYKKMLIKENNGLLTRSKMAEILDDINNSIDVVVEEIGNSKTAD